MSMPAYTKLERINGDAVRKSSEKLGTFFKSVFRREDMTDPGYWEHIAKAGAVYCLLRQSRLAAATVCYHTNQGERPVCWIDMTARSKGDEYRGLGIEVLSTAIEKEVMRGWNVAFTASMKYMELYRPLVNDLWSNPHKEGYWLFSKGKMSRVEVEGTYLEISEILDPKVQQAQT
jgi:hypothetical protein